jgi:hypothetical protein
MKVSMLGLAVSTVAFGGSTLYLWSQLATEREQIAAVQEANAQLTARIAELEKRRAEFAERRMGGPGTFEGAVMAHAGPGPEKGGPPPDEGQRQVFTTVRQGPGHKTPEMPPAMLKMMRANIRAQNKRMYFDLQSKLGLTDEQANAMLDLLTDQQTAGFRNRNLDPEQAREYWEQEQQKRKTDIADLLGSAKAAQFEEYQKSMPARSELSMLSQQLEGAEMPLTDDQKSKMLTALMEERERIPMPTYAEGTEQEKMMKSYNEWQLDYEKRVADQARSILTSEQLSAYNEYAQWQKEMREQFATNMPPPPRGAVTMRGDAVGVAAAPAPFVSAVIVNAGTEDATVIKEQSPKSK